MGSSGESRLRAILDEAISAEESAYNLYDRAMSLVKNEQARSILRELRDEEKLHKEMLESAEFESWETLPEEDKNEDITISDFLVGGELKEDVDFQQVLIFAAKKERGAREFYTGASKIAAGKAEKEFFLKLAQMEEKHEKKCEALYWETYGG